MNRQKIQALRGKHYNDGNGCCAFCTDGYVWAADYPCDAIRVLDAYDALLAEHPDAMSVLERTVDSMNRIDGVEQ